MKKQVTFRIIYTICFLLLLIVDWTTGTMTGRVQFVMKNCTGIVIAIIILSMCRIKDFLKPVYALWTGIVLVGAPIVIVLGIKYYPYKGQWITAVINACIYGYIVLRVVIKQLVEKKLSEIRWIVFFVWIAMIVLMILSRNEAIWPLWFGGIFGSFYLLEYESAKKEILYKGLIDGVILGFFLIQGTALLFRPYDSIRYLGLFLNPNINALFYLMSFCAFLGKWFIMSKEKKPVVLRVLAMLFSGAMIGFCILTGSRTALLSMVVVIIPFAICMSRISKRKVSTVIVTVLSVFVIGAGSFPITYLAVRYVPTIHLHPVFFQYEYHYAYKIHSGEPRDSEKYTTFDSILEYNFGKIIETFYYRTESKLNKIFPVMRVYASETETVEEVLITDNNYSGINTRYQIHKWYFEKLNLFGHLSSEHGVKVSDKYIAPHAHNWWLQLTFDFGIPVGILLIGGVVLYVIRFFSLLKEGENLYACIIGCFITAFLVFGFFEVDYSLGQLPFTLFFFLFKEVIDKPAIKQIGEECLQSE